MRASHFAKLKAVRFSALLQILQPARATRVVDIGANPIDSDPPYLRMLTAGIAEVVGFEPQVEALAELERLKSPRERYLPYAIGDGEERLLKVCTGSGMTSLLEPDPIALSHFSLIEPHGQVVERVPVQTKRLDDVAEIESIDFLKLDNQGFELTALQNGRQKLKQAVAVQTEVSFVALYQGQPSFGEIDLEMRSQGFIPHHFAELKPWVIAPTIVDGDPRTPLNQLLEADVVYVRDFMHPQNMSDEQLKHLCLIAHICYRSWDLANRCILILEERGSLPTGSQNRYFDTIAAGEV
jgi:FkbM family methyltransferase